MGKRTKIILVMLLAGVAMAAGQHHFKKLFKTSFSDDELPKDVGVNLFNLGKITDQTRLSDIKGPAEDETFVQFNFQTESGEDVKLLMRRTKFTRERHARVKVDNQHAEKHTKHKEKIKALIGKNAHALETDFYRLDPETNEWHHIFNVLDHADNYRFAPTFDVVIFANGLAVFHAHGKKPAIFQATGDQVKVSDDRKRIEIGNGKEISSDDLRKSLRGDVKLHEEEELP